MNQIKIFTGAGSEWPGNIEINANEFLKKNPTYEVIGINHTQHLEGSTVTIVYKGPVKTKED